MYEVLMVLIITDFEWTWLSYIIDLLVTYTNSYTYMSCTCQNERAYIGTACCFILFLNSCENNMLKTVLLSKLAQQHIWCDAHSLAQSNVDDTICSAMFVECPAMRFSYSILKW